MHGNAATRLASRQHGIITRRQLLRLGWSEDQIDGCAWLLPLHRGVFAVGSSALREEGRLLAAVAATRPRAWLSHTSAAYLWGLIAVPSGDVHVTTRAGARGGAGIEAHRSRTLLPHHRTVLRGVPTTTLPKTIVDAAALLSLDDLVRATATAHRERRLTPRQLQRALDEHHGARGTKNVRLLLDDGLMVTRSEFERRFLAFVAANGWPRPRVNRHVLGHRADFHWPTVGLVVEADGFAFHRDRLAFEDDHDRDLDWQTGGLTVRRITWRQLTRTPAKVRRALRPLM